MKIHKIQSLIKQNYAILIINFSLTLGCIIWDSIFSLYFTKRTQTDLNKANLALDI